jgi:hypothetical protein
MNAALKKIQARVKKLRKKHPGAKFRTLQKQAGAEYRAGKLKTKRKHTIHKKKSVHRKRVSSVGPVRRHRKGAKRRAPRTVIITKYRTVGKVKRTRKKHHKRYVKAKRITHCRSVGGMSKGTKTALMVGGAVVLGYLLVKSMTPAAPPITLTNPASVSSANTLVTAAQAAGYSATAIANLVKSINASSDAQVQSAATSVTTSGTLPAVYQTALATPDPSLALPALVAPTLNFN